MGKVHTAGYLSVGAMAQCVVHALRSQIIFFSMGPKRRYPPVRQQAWLNAKSGKIKGVDYDNIACKKVNVK